MKNSVRNEDPRRSRNDVGNTYNKYYGASLGGNKIINQHQKMHPPMNSRQNFVSHEKNLYYNQTVGSSQYAYDPKIQWAIENGYLQPRGPNPRPVYLNPKGVQLETTNLSSCKKIPSYSVVPFLCEPQSTSKVTLKTERKSQIFIDPKSQTYEGEHKSQLYRELVANVQYKKMVERANASPKTLPAPKKLPALSYGEPKIRRPEHFANPQHGFRMEETDSAQEFEGRSSITTSSIEILEEEVEEEEITYETEDVEVIPRMDQELEIEEIQESYDPQRNVPRVPKHSKQFVAQPFIQQPSFLNKQVNYCVRSPQTKPLQKYVDSYYKNFAPRGKSPHPSPADAARFAYSEQMQDPVWSQQNYYRENMRLRQSFDADSTDTNEFQSPMGSMENFARFPKETPRTIRIPKHFVQEEEQVVPSHTPVSTYHKFVDSHGPKSLPQGTSNSRTPHGAIAKSPDQDNSNRLGKLMQKPLVSNIKRLEKPLLRSGNVTPRQDHSNSRRSSNTSSRNKLEDVGGKSSDHSSFKSANQELKPHEINTKGSEHGFSKHQPLECKTKRSDHSSVKSAKQESNLHELNTKDSEHGSFKYEPHEPKTKQSSKYQPHGIRPSGFSKLETHDIGVEQSEHGSSKQGPPECKTKHSDGGSSKYKPPESKAKHFEHGSSKYQPHGVSPKCSSHDSPKYAPPECKTKRLDRGSSKIQTRGSSSERSQHGSSKYQPHELSPKCSDHGSSKYEPSEGKTKRLDRGSSKIQARGSSSERSQQGSSKLQPHELSTKRSIHGSSKDESQEPKDHNSSKNEPFKSANQDNSSSKPESKPNKTHRPDHSSSRPGAKSQDVSNKPSDHSSCKSANQARKRSQSRDSSPGHKPSDHSSCKSVKPERKPRDVSRKRSDESSFKSAKPNPTSNTCSEASSSKSASPPYKPLHQSKPSEDSKKPPQEKPQKPEKEDQGKPSTASPKQSCTKKNSIISNKTVTARKMSKERPGKPPEEKKEKLEKDQIKTEQVPCTLAPIPPPPPPLPVSKPSKIPKALNTRPKTAPSTLPQLIFKREKTETATDTNEESTICFESCGTTIDPVASSTRGTMVESTTATVETTTIIPETASTLTETTSFPDLSKESSCETENYNNLPEGPITDLQPPENRCDIDFIMEKIKDFQKTLEKHNVAAFKSSSSFLKPVAISAKRSENSEQGLHPEQKLLFRVTASQRTMNAGKEEKITKKSSPSLHTKDLLEIDSSDSRNLNRKRELSQRVLSLNKMQSVSAEISRKIIELDQKFQQPFTAEKRQSLLISEISQRAVNLDEQLEISPEVSQKVIDLEHESEPESPRISEADIKVDQNLPILQKSNHKLMNTDLNQRVTPEIEKLDPEPSKSKPKVDSDHQIEEILKKYRNLGQKRPESPRTRKRFDDDEDQIKESNQNRPESPKSTQRTEEVKEFDQKRPSPRTDDQIEEFWKKRPKSPPRKEELGQKPLDSSKSKLEIQENRELDQKRPESPKSKRRVVINEFDDQKRPDFPKNKQTIDDNDQIKEIYKESPKSKQRLEENNKEGREFEQERPESPRTRRASEVDQNRPESPRHKRGHSEETRDVGLDPSEPDQKRPESPKHKRRHSDQVEVIELDGERPKHKSRHNDQVGDEPNDLVQKRPESPRHKRRHGDQVEVIELDGERAKHKSRHDNDEQVGEEPNDLVQKRPKSPKHQHGHENTEEVDKEKRPDSPRRKHKRHNSDQTNELDQQRPESPRHKHRDRSKDSGKRADSPKRKIDEGHKDPYNQRSISIDQELVITRDANKAEMKFAQALDETRKKSQKFLDLNQNQPVSAEVRHITINLDEEQDFISKIRQRVMDPNHHQTLLSDIRERVNKFSQRQLSQRIADFDQSKAALLESGSVQSQISQRSSKDEQRQPMFFQMKHVGGAGEKPHTSTEILHQKQPEITPKEESKDKEVIQVHKRQKKPKKSGHHKPEDKPESCRASTSKTTIRNPSKKFVEARYDRLAGASSSSCSDYGINRKGSPVRTCRASSPIVCRIGDSVKSQPGEKEDVPKPSMASTGAKSIKSLKNDSLKHKQSRPRSTLEEREDTTDKRERSHKHVRDDEIATCSKYEDKQKAKLKKRATSRQVRKPPESLVQSFYKYCLAILLFFKNYPCKYILKYLLFL